jgi:hypothetical protein
MLLGLLFSAIFCSIIGGIVAGVTGISFLFWVVSIALFVISLPFTLIDGFIQDKIDYVQDREDDRMLMRELSEDLRHEEYLEHLEDNKHNHITYNIDARSIHFHNHSGNRTRDKKGRLISKNE